MQLELTKHVNVWRLTLNGQVLGDAFLYEDGGEARSVLLEEVAENLADALRVPLLQKFGE